MKSAVADKEKYKSHTEAFGFRAEFSIELVESQ